MMNFTARKLSALALVASFAATPLSAIAGMPEDSNNTAMLRFSYVFGHDDKPAEPWIGLNIAQSKEFMPWERKAEEKTESAVSFNLAAPEMALTNQGSRTILSLNGDVPQLQIGCGDEPKHDSNLASTAVGVVMVGALTYLVINSEVTMKGC